MNAKRASLRPFRAFCAHCAPDFRRARRLLIAAFVLLVAGAFVLGRYSSPPTPFYFIGTPVDPHPNDTQSSTAGENKAQPQQQPPASTTAVETLCGAPTKSGRPCRRKVRGGGYCYQHRDKSKQ
ncbi:MAG: hypothetical protein L0229_21605 [Blastocatellia bacterium]|nr:hypothetical protein [Blastocatellia bacterium]